MYDFTALNDVIGTPEMIALGKRYEANAEEGSRQVKSRSIFLLFAAITVLSAITNALRAEDYPARPIKLVVGAPAGGTTDTVARFHR